VDLGIWIRSQDIGKDAGAKQHQHDKPTGGTERLLSYQPDKEIAQQATSLVRLNS
jgi:hypothetical protein